MARRPPRKTGPQPAYLGKQELTPEEARELLIRTGRSKYHNKITVVDGIKFRSKKEAGRYEELKILQRLGLIGPGLLLQVSHRIVINGVHVCTYVSDFEYTENGKLVVEDVKGCRTPYYKLKKKLMWAVNGIRIKEL